MIWIWLASGLGIVLLVLAFLARVWRRGRTGIRQARARFEAQRPTLEQAFRASATASGKPRGLIWVDLDWEPGVLFARERTTGHLAALVGVTVRFEAIPGSDMEHLPAVGNLRTATAVFFFDRGHWHTTGRTLFNLNPGEAVVRFGGQYEAV